MSFEEHKTYFKDWKAARAAINDFNEEHEKSCRMEQKKSNSLRRTFVCSDSMCNFKLEFTRKRPSRGIRPSHVSHVPEGGWYVSSFCDHADISCMSKWKVPIKKLSALPGFKAGVLGSKEKVATRSQLQDIAIEAHKMKELTDGRVIKARDGVLKEARAEDSYGKIPHLIKEILRLNEGSKASLQVDSKDRFYRLFLMLGSSMASLAGCLPVLELDGTFMKSDKYNGVCVVITGKTGEFKNLPLAIAFVPSETTENFAWVFMHLKAAGIRMNDYAIFTDRGKQLNAYNKLYHLGCRWLHIKSCTYHISKNVASKFHNYDAELRSKVFDLQESSSIASYLKKLKEINGRYDKPFLADFSNIRDSILFYLMKLHPTQFAVAGNVKLTEEEEAMLKFIWGPCGLNGYGEPKALFGHRTTNGVEGENNSLLHEGFRFKPVHDAVNEFIKRYVLH